VDTAQVSVLFRLWFALGRHHGDVLSNRSASTEKKTKLLSWWVS
jgi:hypothetical protein